MPLAQVVTELTGSLSPSRITKILHMDQLYQTPVTNTIVVYPDEPLVDLVQPALVLIEDTSNAYQPEPPDDPMRTK